MGSWYDEIMATTFGGADPPDERLKKKKEERDKQHREVPKYADLFKEKSYVHENNKVLPKQVIMVQGEPT